MKDNPEYNVSAFSKSSDVLKNNNNFPWWRLQYNNDIVIVIEGDCRLIYSGIYWNIYTIYKKLFYSIKLHQFVKARFSSLNKMFFFYFSFRCTLREKFIKRKHFELPVSAYINVSFILRYSVSLISWLWTRILALNVVPTLPITNLLEPSHTIT